MNLFVNDKKDSLTAPHELAASSSVGEEYCCSSHCISSLLALCTRRKGMLLDLLRVKDEEGLSFLHYMLASDPSLTYVSTRFFLKAMLVKGSLYANLLYDRKGDTLISMLNSNEETQKFTLAIRERLVKSVRSWKKKWYSASRKYLLVRLVIFSPLPRSSASHRSTGRIQNAMWSFRIQLSKCAQQGRGRDCRPVPPLPWECSKSDRSRLLGAV